MSSINEDLGECNGTLRSAALRGCFLIRNHREQSVGDGVQRRGPRQKLISRFGVWLLVATVALGLSVIPLRAGDAVPSEAQMKAAFLLNFPKYVEWPATDFAETNSPIVIAVFGSDEVADEFAKLSERKVINGRSIQLMRAKTAEQCRNCDILFIGSAESRSAAELLTGLRGLNILTVGESDDFLDRGGMINLARRDRRIGLEVNIDSIRQTRLKVSSKLLALATAKGGKK